MKLEDFEQEFFNEIESARLDIETLKKLGVSDKFFSREIYLRKIYGDKIVMDEENDDYNKYAKKSVTRLGEAELGLKDEFAQIFKNIEESNFDQNIDLLGIKFGDN